jgi:CHAT domain-containing protein
VWTVFLACEAQLQLQRGDAASAIASLGKAIDLLRPIAMSFESRGADHVEAALNFAQYLNQLGGSQEQASLPGEALRTYAECRHYLQRITLHVECHADEFPSDPVRSGLLNQARYVLGGVLANEAMLLQRWAEMLGPAASELPHFDFGKLLTLASQLQAFGDRQTRSIIQVLGSDLFKGVSRSASLSEAKASILRVAYGRMREALAISVGLQGWNYGSIQAMNCADLAEALAESAVVITDFREQAIGFAESARNLANLSLMCARMAEFKERSGSLDAAAEYWIKAVKHSRAHAIAASTTATADDLRRTYRGMVARAFDLLSRLGRAFECVALAETAKSVFFSLDIQHGIPGMRPTGNSALSARLEALLAERERCTKAFLENESGRGEAQGANNSRSPSEPDRIVTLDAEIAALRREIAATDPRIGSWTRWSDVHDLSAEELRNHLRDSNSVAIGAFSAGDDIHLYVVCVDDCVLCPTSLRRSEAAEAVNFFQQLAKSHHEMPLASVLDTLRERFPALAWIEEHAARLIKPATRYIIVAPDDALYGFPWAILAPAGRPLAQNAPIVIAVGLDSVLTSAKDTDAITSGQCLVLSDPLAGSHNSLPGAAEETRLIVENWGPSSVTVLVGAQATVRALAEAAPRSRLIHLACHGRFGGIGENSAELRLAPCNDQLTQTGILTPAEIVRSLDLTTCSLVNISACGVGRLRENDGAGVDGIVSAFLIVGARNVVGSVSALEDTAAATFSGRFYEELATGTLPAHALARTQLACLNGELGSRMRSPQYWAGYLVFCAAVK